MPTGFWAYLYDDDDVEMETKRHSTEPSLMLFLNKTAFAGGGGAVKFLHFTLIMSKKYTRICSSKYRRFEKQMVRIFRAEAVYFSETSLSTYMASQP